MRNAECGRRNGRAGFDPRRESSDATRARSIPHSALVASHLAFPCAPYALAHPQAAHCRRPDRARAPVGAVYLDGPDLDLLERRARRLRPEVFKERMDL